MLQEIIETGKTVDSAIESACEKMGCARDDCDFEIIDLPKKAFFGLKNVLAKVRVFREIPDPVPPKQEALPKKEAPPAVPGQPERAPRPARRADQRAEQSKAPGEQNTAPAHNQKAAVQQSAGLSTLTPEKEKAILDYLSGIVAAMGLNAELSLTEEDGEVSVRMTGENLGAMIGRRGETLDAIQYLTGLVANRLDGEYLRITVDCGDYRLKRKKTLQDLAARLAERVLKTNINKTLEPMSPFERRIIHSTVSEIEGVSSKSVGEEPYRRVVISTPTSSQGGAGGAPRRRPTGGQSTRERDGARSAGSRRPEGEGRSGERRGGRGRGGNGPRRPAPVVQQPPAEPKTTPEQSSGGALYEKIDLQ